MTVEEFRRAYSRSEKVGKICSQLNYNAQKLNLRGLIGSTKTLIADAVIQNKQGDHLFILADKEEAAFFLNDLQNLDHLSNSIYFFPHSYKRAYQLEEIDNANVVSRAEVLERINRGTNSVIVTYPEAIFEKVITKKQFATRILEVKQGATYSIDFINELLIEYEFEKVDFVYSPGQFAVRGGIVDVFSFSNDEPFRVEFFGDEVETIRTIDPVNQLSIKTLTRFTVVPNIQHHKKEEVRESFLDFVSDQTIIWVKDYLVIEEELEKQYQKALDIFNSMAASPVKHSPPVDLFVDRNQFRYQVEKFRVVEFAEQD